MSVCFSPPFHNVTSNRQKRPLGVAVAAINDDRQERQDNHKKEQLNGSRVALFVTL